MSQPVNVYATPELQDAVDEALPVVFERLGYTQNFKLIDMKILIGYSMALVAGISFLLDRKFKWQEVIEYQKLLVTSYAILSGIWWVYRKYVVQDITYCGEKNGETIKVKTKFDRYDPNCKVLLIDNSGKRLDCQLQAVSVFNEYGFLQFNQLYSWFEEQLKQLKCKKD